MDTWPRTPAWRLCQWWRRRRLWRLCWTPPSPCPSWTPHTWEDRTCQRPKTSRRFKTRVKTPGRTWTRRLCSGPRLSARPLCPLPGTWSTSQRRRRSSSSWASPPGGRPHLCWPVVRPGRRGGTRCSLGGNDEDYMRTFWFSPSTLKFSIEETSEQILTRDILEMRNSASTWTDTW